MDDRKLREYALKIYKGESGYSLQKAFSLFPKYYPKIAVFYTELVSQKQNKLTTRMIQALGIDKADELKKLSIVASHKKLEMFKLKVTKELNILDLNMLNFDKRDYKADLYINKMYKKQAKILKDVKKHPKKYLAQKRFYSKPLVSDEGESFHVCIGSYGVEDNHAGYYARVSKTPRIDSYAADIPVLIERG